MSITRVLSIFISMLNIISLEIRAEDGSYRAEVLPLLQTYCLDCHAQPDEMPSGDFSLTQFSSLTSVKQSPHEWKKVLEALVGYEMPPQDGLELSEPDRQRLIRWIRDLFAEPEFHQPGKPVLRRLTRLEYNNTIRDLLGLETDVFIFSERLPFDKRYFNPSTGKMPDRLSIPTREYGARYPVFLPDAGLPGDSRAEHGFSNRGDAQDLSAVRMEEYVALAEQICFHPELLTRARRMEELFPQADFQSPAPQQRQKKEQQTVNASARIGPNENIAKTAEGSDLSLDQFRELVAEAYEEDRGGVLDVSQNLNSVIPGKGGLSTIAYGKNAFRAIDLNPSEDIWLVSFATAEESSGSGLMANKSKNLKKFFFGFQQAGDQTSAGIGQLGMVILSRRGQSGTVRVTVSFNNETERSIDVSLKPGSGVDNTFVSFVSPEGLTIRKLHIDGSDFSGEYVLLDDLVFITRDQATTAKEIAGRELPTDDPDDETPADASAQQMQLRREIAKQSPRDRLAYFMRRAFRRPIHDDEVELYFRLYQSTRAAGEDDEFAMRRAMQGILSSPSFLYLLERGVPPRTATQTTNLSDHELATRLSYFLWSSLPDDELLALADAGQLHNDQVLEQQVRRMLRDPRVRELSENFFVEWLRLRELWSAQPDRRMFKDFYDGPKGKRTLAPEMFCEALLLIETILVEDRSLTELIDCDYTWVNKRLAELYQLEPPQDDKNWQRVSLEGTPRGGVLTMAGTLTLTSFPHRTSPIKRGAWFLETIFNRPPPPPKIAVAEIDEQESDDKTLTLRQKTELHRDNPACAVCHDRIDPPGFALENFNAIGEWRVLDDKEPIDPTGTLVGAGTFAGPEEFKQRILEREERFLRGFTEHLLSYAISRELDYRDTATVDAIVLAAAEDDHRLSRVIVEIVKSPAFRQIELKN